MSKKKVFSGPTMTLKDFHGGSIPSDLPLPSAPGAPVRLSDRPVAWGNPMGRSDHRLRPGSSPGARNFDDKTAPFLTHTTHIGRNFDEDERKPLDGVSSTRRTVSDDSIYAPASRVEAVVKPDSYSARVSSPGSPLPVVGVGTYSGRHNEVTHSQNSGGNGSSTVSGSHSNVWTARREVVASSEPVPLSWSGPSAFSKLAQASALEKVSSGRWQSKQPIHHQADVEVIHHSEIEGGLHFKGTNNLMYIGTDRGSGRECFDESIDKHLEGILTFEDEIHGGSKDFQCYDLPRSPVHFDVREGKPWVYGNGAPSVDVDGLSGRSGLQPLVASESSDRPKLKLLPRSKPLESLEAAVVGHKQPSDVRQMETATESHANFNSTKQGLSGTEGVNRLPERPKLNLRPRTQPLEQSKGTIKEERTTLFGGARPRELVLKERGMDDISDNGHVQNQAPNRIKLDDPKAEVASGRPIPARHTEKGESLPLDHRIGKNSEKEYRVDVERGDMQKRNWRNENWRNSRETEKQQHQPEREHSPETWRRPVEQPKQTSGDATGVRYGKVASAIELAQAFSKSVSEPNTSDRVSGPRGHLSQPQMPFSRLVGQKSRPQINGY